ncbi:MAG: hypothetical protein M3Q47_01720 [Actinomycetota bacterium]|nr:hypothetical protein [Actinomycetota bacterium]
MTDPRVKDTILVTVVSSGLVALALFVMAIVTGRGWWIAVFMTVATMWFGILYGRELRRFKRHPGGPAGP